MELGCGIRQTATIVRDIDDAMDAIEKDNPSLKGVLPKVYAQENWIKPASAVWLI